jgi:hypothetical protein
LMAEGLSIPYAWTIYTEFLEHAKYYFSYVFILNSHRSALVVVFSSYI